MEKMADRNSDNLLFDVAESRDDEYLYVIPTGIEPRGIATKELVSFEWNTKINNKNTHHMIIYDVQM